MLNFSKVFVEIIGFFGKDKWRHFWIIDSFSNALNRLKILNFATIKGAFAPDRMRGALDRLLVASLPPPNQSPPYATTTLFFLLSSFLSIHNFWLLYLKFSNSNEILRKNQIFEWISTLHWLKSVKLLCTI